MRLWKEQMERRNFSRSEGPWRMKQKVKYRLNWNSKNGKKNFPIKFWTEFRREEHNAEGLKVIMVKWRSSERKGGGRGNVWGVLWWIIEALLIGRTRGGRDSEEWWERTVVEGVWDEKWKVKSVMKRTTELQDEFSCREINDGGFRRANDLEVANRSRWTKGNKESCSWWEYNRTGDSVVK